MTTTRGAHKFTALISEQKRKVFKRRPRDKELLVFMLGNSAKKKRTRLRS